MKRIALIYMLLAWLSAVAAIGSRDAQAALERLDRALGERQQYIDRRQHTIDSLSERMLGRPYCRECADSLAAAYVGFNNDSALAVLLRAPQADARVQMRLAAQLPLSGLFEQAEHTLQAVDTTAMDTAALAMYYDRGRQMYSYLAAFFERYPQVQSAFAERSRRMQQRLVELLPPDSPEYLMNFGEEAMLGGNRSRARMVLGELMERPALADPLRARAAHHLAMLAKAEGHEDAMIYYLAESAISDVRAATREVTSLQELGSTLSARGDIDRAYAYLSVALTNAVECAADVRMLESARSLPVIEQAYARKTAGTRRTMMWLIAAFAALALVLVGVLVVLLREMRQMRRLQQRLTDANRAKELSISQFLSLCSMYMDKLKQISKLVARKIGAGQAEELHRMARNGKLVEDESRDFYAVFDQAFLSIYPGFPAAVNALLLPDQQLPPAEPGRLNTDLRLLAFMRLGITDSASIARVMNYSLNTVYAYRNRLRARAIRRDTFEHDILAL